MYSHYDYKTVCNVINVEFPPQDQHGQPGVEAHMVPRPVSELPNEAGPGKLQGKVALITGGDSGIGRAVAYLFAREGADISVVYLNEHVDAEETKRTIERLGRRCLTISGDIGEERFCQLAVHRTISGLGRIDILINNAGVSYFQPDFERITAEQLERTFRTNVFSQFYMVKAAIPYLKPGSSIINTSSISAVKGYPGLADYSASKGAVSAFTRSLAVSLIARGIRVNAVAPGRTWTPLIPASFPTEIYMSYGSFENSGPMRRTAQPYELAPIYLYLASNDSSFVIGQTMHVDGGEFYGL